MIKLIKCIIYLLLAPAALIAMGFVLALDALFKLVGGDNYNDYSNQ